ncbi:hypothetical protein LSUB1_G004204 [Lachnellula subtilissima]|uniref:PAS domain-containing protein n=1 Tax=Lachnellula subtilissima TaxID=602034 RepID=A0A8H8RNZ9_9HELO|nr:hypothetical protein LSUB1_G004204 [Lachnellula subtilissima]
METTFMTIHNLTPNANIMFASESIADILGYRPDEVTGRSCFEYFHPDEIPFARNIHSRGVQLDKAAVLHYARIRGRHGQWVSCECVFTIVYEVLVACTSIYRRDVNSDRRAAEAPAVRHLFASSPRDPRYHMLEHLSAKFRTPPQASLREPRAAIVLNRFTRTLTVMYATNAVSSILGITPEQFTDKSFYECIQENCLPEAIRCLESAKANDSIAYLRFWYRDPRRDEDLDQDMREDSQSSDSEEGGAVLGGQMDVDSAPAAESTTANQNMAPSVSSAEAHHTSSGDSSDLDHTSSGAIFDQSHASRSSTSSLVLVSPEERRRARPTPIPQAPAEPFELEAVISCTSDGLVVILRRARPRIPQPEQVLPPIQAFAPWGVDPIRPHVYQPDLRFPFQHGFDAPQYVPGGPPVDDFLNVIRDVGCFAWSLVGINGNIGAYSRGFPKGEATPPGGMPIWDPYAQPNPDYAPPENQAALRWAREATIQPADEKAPYHHSARQENPFGSFQNNHEGNMHGNAHEQPGVSSNQDLHANMSPITQDQGRSEGGRSDRDLWY